jgi:hypothetical protein
MTDAIVASLTVFLAILSLFLPAALCYRKSPEPTPEELVRLSNEPAYVNTYCAKLRATDHARLSEFCRQLIQTYDKDIRNRDLLNGRRTRRV